MSRGRRDVRRCLTTLLVLGSMTMRLLLFSLLTKTRPVSLAHPAEDNAAANTTMQNGADNRRRMSTGDPLLLAKTIDPSVRLIQVAGQAVNAPTLPSPGARVSRPLLFRCRRGGRDARRPTGRGKGRGCLQCNFPAHPEGTHRWAIAPPGEIRG